MTFPHHSNLDLKAFGKTLPLKDLETILIISLSFIYSFCYENPENWGGGGQTLNLTNNFFKKP